MRISPVFRIGAATIVVFTSPLSGRGAGVAPRVEETEEEADGNPSRLADLARQPKEIAIPALLKHPMHKKVGERIEATPAAKALVSIPGWDVYLAAELARLSDQARDAAKLQELIKKDREKMAGIKDVTQEERAKLLDEHEALRAKAASAVNAQIKFGQLTNKIGTLNNDRIVGLLGPYLTKESSSFVYEGDAFVSSLEEAAADGLGETRFSGIQLPAAPYTSEIEAWRAWWKQYGEKYALTQRTTARKAAKETPIK
jgi:hypothetical protein